MTVLDLKARRTSSFKLALTHLYPELAILAAAIAAAMLFSDDLGFLTRINITCLFALSLSLLIGQAGIPTLGQAALYGTGAYAAGLFAIHVYADPLIGLVVGALSGGLIALVSGTVILHSRGLTCLMLTVAVTQVLGEAANKAASVTGGDDGLADIPVSKILGRFEFDLSGVVSFWYTLVVLIFAFAILRMIIASPFGLTCRGIKEDRVRMTSIGTPVFHHLLAVYGLSGIIAGLAGALSAQTTQVVGLNSLGFELSADVLVMVVLGGTQGLGGALIGVPAFMVLQRTAASINPYHWLFVVGAVLILTVLFLPRGLQGFISDVTRKVVGGRHD
jgi:branched-chain amino acid transport system permease protein